MGTCAPGGPFTSTAHPQGSDTMWRGAVWGVWFLLAQMHVHALTRAHTCTDMPSGITFRTSSRLHAAMGLCPEPRCTGNPESLSGPGVQGVLGQRCPP